MRESADGEYVEFEKVLPIIAALVWLKHNTKKSGSNVGLALEVAEDVLKDIPSEVLLAAKNNLMNLPS